MGRVTVIHRRGMTLVELLVVIIILGLLGVAAAPAINSSNNKSKLRETAYSVSSHIMRATSQAVGRNAGYGAWLQADDISSVTSPTTQLRFCPGVVEASGTIYITATTPMATVATASMSPSYSLLTGTSVVPDGTLVRVAGFPYDYKLQNETSLSFTGPSATNLWPRPSPNGYQFTLQVPPSRTTGGKTVLAGNTCIDLTSSTFGVLLYTGSAAVATFSNSAPLVLAFDNVGRPKTTTAAFVTSSGTSLQQRAVTADTPIALLVGLRDQVGASYQTTPSEDNPGTNWQRNDAWWVVIDPRSGSVFQVENYPNATSPQIAQRFIRQKLLNRKDAN